MTIQSSTARALSLTLAWVTTLAIMFLTFVVYSALDGSLSLSKVFTTFSLLVALRVSLYNFILSVTFTFDGLVGSERIGVSGVLCV